MPKNWALSGQSGLASLQNLGISTSSFGTSSSSSKVPNAPTLKDVTDGKSAQHLTRRTTKSAFHLEKTPPGELSNRRLCVAHYLHMDVTQIGLAVMILFNMVLVILATDAGARNEQPALWVRTLDYSMLCVFIIELVLRFYVARLHFWRNVFNVVDFLVVVLDILIEVLTFSEALDNAPALGFLRVLRLGRLTRAYRIMVMVPMLSGMCRDLIGAMEAVFWGCMMLGCVLTVWSIIAVQIIHPLATDLDEKGRFGDCSRCGRAFATVMSSNLTFLQQIVAGDSWGQVTIPIIEEHPLTAFIFIPVLVTIALAITNVILAVIVDSAEITRKNDLVDKMRVREGIFMERSKKLLAFCHDLDSDASGELSLDELMTGFKSHAELRLILNDMGIDEEDLVTVFEIMDPMATGAVSYKKFVHHIYKMRTHDEHTTLDFIRHYVMQILRRLHMNDAKLQEAAIEDERIDEDGTPTAALEREQEGLVQKVEADAGVQQAKLGHSTTTQSIGISFKPVRVADKEHDRGGIDPAAKGQLQELQESLAFLTARVDETFVAKLQEISDKCERQATLLSCLDRTLSPVRVEVTNLISNLSSLKSSPSEVVSIEPTTAGRAPYAVEMAPSNGSDEVLVQRKPPSTSTCLFCSASEPNDLPKQLMSLPPPQRLTARKC